MLDLLLASRHLADPSASTNKASKLNDASPRPPPSTFLCATVLDTLLCILVDSPTALRGFEDVGGLQIAVKLLKRSGTPREVR
jgi:hypothetical protein